MNRNINVTLYKGTEPLLIAMDIHKEIKAALNVKVNMPSGGYLFIQQTEALYLLHISTTLSPKVPLSNFTVLSSRTFSGLYIAIK